MTEQNEELELSVEEAKKVVDQEIESATDELMTDEDVKKSAMAIQFLYSQFRPLAKKLASRKKNGPMRVLEAFLLDGLEPVEVFGKEEETLLDMSRNIMYHKEILLNAAIQMKQKKEAQNEQKEK